MKLYYNQFKVSSSLSKFFASILNLSKPILKVLSFIILGMISAESIVTSDIARKLKDSFSYVQLESTERRFRRFFEVFSKTAYSVYDTIICYVISKFKVKHSDKNIHISFDHMFCFDKFTVLLFSLRIGSQGIPLWFRCFKGKYNPAAFKSSLINKGISYCYNLFKDKNYHIIFLADRWFPKTNILSHIESLNCFYCIRTISNIRITYPDCRGFVSTKKIRDISPSKYHTKVLKDVLITKWNFKTTLVISYLKNTDEPWFLLTNDRPDRAIRNYSYRFGSIECIFKSQKSNGFRLESTNTQKISHFISLFTVTCIALLWLTILGADYSKNKHNYKIKIRDVRHHKSNKTTRVYSFFNLGLTLFNLCYYNEVEFTLKFNFILYDS